MTRHPFPDIKLNAEILSYSRSKGIFAGLSLDGAVMQADQSGDKALYGANVDRHQIVNGTISVPPSAKGLIHEVNVYAGAGAAKGMYLNKWIVLN